MGLWKRAIHVGLVTVVGSALVACNGNRTSAASSNATEEEFNLESVVTGDPRPPVDLVNQVEAKLLAEECVGDLNCWERLYSYGFDSRRRSVDTSVVAFMFREAGVHGFRSARRITEPLTWVNLDDRAYNLVHGRYLIREQTLEIEYCGPSVAQPPS